MNPLHRHIKNLITKKSRDYLGISIQAFKLLFYVSITGGILWNLAYYGLVAKNLPDFRGFDVAGYLIIIFGTGVFFIVLFCLSFLLPGIVLLLSESAHRDRSTLLPEWLSAKVYRWVSNCHLLFIAFAFLNVVIIITYSESLQKLLIKNLVYSKSPLYLQLIYLLTVVIILSLPTGITTFLTKPPFKKEVLLPIFASFLIFFVTAIPFSLVAGATVEATNRDLGFFTFVMLLFCSAGLNSKMALDGFDYFKDQKPVKWRSFSRKFMRLLATCLIVVLIFSYISILSDKPNPFLIVPYRALGIGYINAYLFLDEEFVGSLKKEADKKVMFEKSTNQLKFCFEVLSSIGTEYIVKPLPDKECKPKSSDKPQDIKNKTGQANTDNAKQQQEQATTHKTSYEHTLRIPKDKVLLVEYIENKKSK